jgi:hypothetical protein
MQAHRNEDKMEMDQIKGVSTNVPTDNKFEIYLMDNVKGVNHVNYTFIAICKVKIQTQ